MAAAVINQPKDTVVIAVDASKQAEEALSWYVTHLHREHNNVVLVHGMELPSVPTRETWEKQHSEGSKKMSDLKDRFIGTLQNAGVTGKFSSDFEKPGEYICEMARKENAAYIVMGTRGMGKIRRTIMGSVSDFVVHHAGCPVVVCRQK